MKELDKAITALEEAKAKIDAMLAQNNGLKTADDAQNNGKRWFFNLEDQCSIRTNFGDDPVDLAWMLANPSEWLEVQESDLPYLEKPVGEWVFKKPENGEVYLKRDNSIITCTSDRGAKDGSCEGLAQGYRWVKTPEVAPDVTPEVTDLDGLTVNNNGAVESEQSDNIKFVEYPIYINGCEYGCAVEHVPFIHHRLHELPSIVGFAGVQFADSDQWFWNIFKPDRRSIESRPATPIKARFWIKTPTLNDK